VKPKGYRKVLVILPAPSISKDTEKVQSDTTGCHKVTIVQTCPDQNQYHNRQCDTSIDNEHYQ
jgi:hypothetical protein